MFTKACPYFEELYFINQAGKNTILQVVIDEKFVNSKYRAYLSVDIKMTNFSNGGLIADQMTVFLSFIGGPPRNPDLTPCDFYIEVYIKNSIFYFAKD